MYRQTYIFYALIESEARRKRTFKYSTEREEELWNSKFRGFIFFSNLSMILMKLIIWIYCKILWNSISFLFIFLISIRGDANIYLKLNWNSNEQYENLKIFVHQLLYLYVSAFGFLFELEEEYLIRGSVFFFWYKKSRNDGLTLLSRRSDTS